MKFLKLKAADFGEYFIPSCIAVHHIVGIHISPNGPNGKWLVVITTTDGSYHTEEYDTFEEALDAYCRIYTQLTEDR